LPLQMASLRNSQELGLGTTLRHCSAQWNVEEIPNCVHAKWL
jgi:hypothetical protein